MMVATADEVLSFVADVIETVERHGAVVQPPNDVAEVALSEERGDLMFELALLLPTSLRSRDVNLTLNERWRRQAPDWYELVEYSYDLRDRELDYPRALHRQTSTTSSEGTTSGRISIRGDPGSPVCGHYSGFPVNGAIEASVACMPSGWQGPSQTARV